MSDARLTSTGLSPLRRGSSGADVIIDTFAKRAYKFSNDVAIGERILRQGRFLYLHPRTSFPVVSRINERGYEMEILDSYILDSESRDKILYDVIETLRTDVWTESAKVDFNSSGHIHKVFKLCMDYALISFSKFEKVFGSIQWDKLPICLTHGDPTVDNAMSRFKTFDMVLIDPLPATDLIPNYRAVDVGKVLQSAYNYEFIRYNIDPSPPVYSYKKIFDVAEITDRNEQLASLYFGAVHFLRALPYVPGEMVSKLRTFGMRQLLELCLEMMEDDAHDSL
jgi:hypothetical protein